MGRGRLCTTCAYCGDCDSSSAVVRRHILRKHPAGSISPGVSPSGRSWRCLGESHPHIWVSLQHEGEGKNSGGHIGLCTLCGENWHPVPGYFLPRPAVEKWFQAHTCPAKQTREYKATVPTDAVGGMSARAGPVKGVIVTAAHLEALAKKYRGFDTELRDDLEVDVMATLEKAASRCSELDAREVAERKCPGAVGGDPWAAVLTSMADGTSTIAAHVRDTWDAAKEQYVSEKADWDEDHEDDEEPPMLPAMDALNTLAMRSAKLDAAQTANKAAAARACQPLEAEIRALTVENSGLRSRSMALEGNNVSLAQENSRLSAEIAQLRAALAAATNPDD